MTDRPFAPSAHLYDLLYEVVGKDYEVEANEIHVLIQARRPGAASLLDVACGTGAHLFHLRDRYDVTGVDLEPGMLDEARKRLPDTPLHEGDMRTFDLGRTYDAVTCLFSAVGYMQSVDELEQAVQTFERHLAPGGVVIVDGWIRRESWIDPGMVQALAANKDGRAVTRVVHSRRDGVRTTLELHHLDGSNDGVSYSMETHHLTLFSDEEYRAAFEHAGLRVEVVACPHPERDRYVGVKSP